MIHFARLLHDEKSIAFLSFLIGMGLMVLLFHKPYESTDSLTLPVSKVEQTTVRHDGKCYSFKAEDSVCKIR